MVQFFGYTLLDNYMLIFMERMWFSLDRLNDLTCVIPESIVASIARAISMALTDLQRCDILHRDVKPGNVMVGFDGNFKYAY